MIQSLQQIKSAAEAALPGVQLDIIPNGAPSNQPSLLVDGRHALALARFLLEHPQLRLDYVSGVTGVDWPETLLREKVRTRKVVDGVERQFETVVERLRPGYLEAVYHLYSMALKHGPLILRQRTIDRTGQTHVPSLTPVWRGAELQEREIFDLYGIIFDGHPDLRRIFMWDGFKDFPMRKDYREPDDYEWEPTPHQQVLDKTRRHYPPEVKP